jgi:hypothetical protein
VPKFVYLKAYEGVSAAKVDIADYLDWYNAHRPHSSLERLTPHERQLRGNWGQTTVSADTPSHEPANRAPRIPTCPFQHP